MIDPLSEKLGINMQGGTVNVQNLNLVIAERLEQSGDRVIILVVAANLLGSSPLKLDHEVKTIQEALRRLRKSDDFVMEYRLAAALSELRRASTASLIAWRCNSKETRLALSLFRIYHQANWA